MWLRMLAENVSAGGLLAVARQGGDASLPGNGSRRYDRSAFLCLAGGAGSA